MSFEGQPDSEKIKKDEELKALQNFREIHDLATNVAAEMLDMYLEHGLSATERYKKVWLNDNPMAKRELLEMTANEMSNNYKLMDVKMLTRAKVKKNMQEDFIPRKINLILKKYKAI